MNTQRPDESVESDGNAAPDEAPRSLDGTMPAGGDTAPDSANSLQANPAQWVGRRLGKYEITAVLGVGGMGVVLKATDPSIERDVAIKVLPEALSADEHTLRRFMAEAKSAGKLSHPNAVMIHEVAVEGAVHYLVMELVSGGSALEYLEQSGAYPVGEATRIVTEACKGLAAAHKHGLVHRDVKPANLLLAEDGIVKVADFGVAKRTETQTMTLTQAGHLVGTPYFMSPEQCEGGQVDARSDVYSLGATYYSLLTGKYPFQGSGSVVQVMYAHCNAGPPDPREVLASVPAACAQIIQRAMATRPEDRYQSMDEMRVDLETVLASLPGAGIVLPSQSSASLVGPANASAATSRRRFIWALGAGVVLTVLAVAGIAGFMGFFGLGSGELTDSSKTESDTSGAAAPAVAPPTGEPIRVGILHSLSGTMAESESAVVDAMLFAIDEINKSGGLLDRPLKGVVADGRSEPDVFAREAERLIVDEKVCTIFGCWTSASRKTVKPFIEEHDHLLVYPLQYEGLEASPNIVYMGAAPNQQILPAVEWVFTSLGKSRFFLVGSDYVFPRTANEIIKDELSKLGAEVVGEQYLPLGSSDVETAVNGIADAKPDMILNTINGDSNISFFRELRDAGIRSKNCPTLSFSVGEEGLRNLNPEEIAGDYAAWTYFQSIDSTENKEFVSRLLEEYPQHVITDPMESAYVSLIIWASAVRETGSLEPRRLRHAMLEQRFSAPGGEVRLDPDTQHCYKTPRVGQIQSDGTIQVVWTASSPVQPDPFPNSRSATEWLALLDDLYRGWGNHWSPQ